MNKEKLREELRDEFQDKIAEKSIECGNIGFPVLGSVESDYTRWLETKLLTDREKVKATYDYYEMKISDEREKVKRVIEGNLKGTRFMKKWCKSNDYKSLDFYKRLETTFEKFQQELEEAWEGQDE